MDSSGGVADTYTMDAWGNRQESGTFNFTQPFSAANQISATGYVYDSSGNMTADGLGNTYSYDADGKMSASNGAVYTRDSFGQRVRKDYSGAATEYFYFGGALLATRDPSTSHWTDYIYAEGRLIAEIPVTSTDTPFYRIGDHLDSLAQKTDSAGNLLGTNDVSPYGELFSSTASDRLLFTQHERDAENSSDSALYRQYASTQGRWLAPDPYNGSYDLSDPQSLNRYAYVANRPLAATDPLGLGPWDSFLEFITAGLYDHDDNNGPKVSANVETTIGGVYYDAYGTPTLSTYVGVSYSTAGGVFRNLPSPDASFFFRVYSFAFSPTSPRVAATVAPINVAQRIDQAKSLLSNNCKSRFGHTIPRYTTSRFFNTLSHATINQYPTATPPQDRYGVDATTHPPNGPIDLLPNFYGLDQKTQSFVLIHEGIHLFGRGTLGDTAVQKLFGLSEGANSDNITQYIAGGCQQ